MEKYKLYDGKVELEFNNSKHQYTVDNKTVFGVTSIVGVINKPQLMYWAVNQAVDHLRLNLLPGKSYDEIQLKALLDNAKYIHKKTSGTATDIGQMTHSFLEKWIKAESKRNNLIEAVGVVEKIKKPTYLELTEQEKRRWDYPVMPINQEIRNAIDAFLNWTKENKVKFLLSEQKVYSKKYNYAGTLDAEALVNGKLAIIDFKTSKAIYEDYLLQVAAYLQARKEETKQKYKEAYVIRLSKEDKEKNLAAFEVKRSSDLKNDFKTFLGCLSIYQWQQNNRREEIKRSVN